MKISKLKIVTIVLSSLLIFTGFHQVFGNTINVIGSPVCSTQDISTMSAEGYIESVPRIPAIGEEIKFTITNLWYFKELNANDPCEWYWSDDDFLVNNKDPSYTGLTAYHTYTESEKQHIIVKVKGTPRATMDTQNYKTYHLLLWVGTFDNSLHLSISKTKNVNIGESIEFETFENAVSVSWMFDINNPNSYFLDSTAPRILYAYPIDGMYSGRLAIEQPDKVYRLKDFTIDVSEPEPGLRDDCEKIIVDLDEDVYHKNQNPDFNDYRFQGEIITNLFDNFYNKIKYRPNGGGIKSFFENILGEEVSDNLFNIFNSDSHETRKYAFDNIYNSLHSDSSFVNNIKSLFSVFTEKVKRASDFNNIDLTYDLQITDFPDWSQNSLVEFDWIENKDASPKEAVKETVKHYTSEVEQFLAGTGFLDDILDYIANKLGVDKTVIIMLVVFIAILAVFLSIPGIELVVGTIVGICVGFACGILTAMVGFGSKLTRWFDENFIDPYKIDIDETLYTVGIAIFASMFGFGAFMFLYACIPGFSIATCSVLATGIAGGAAIIIESLWESMGIGQDPVARTDRYDVKRNAEGITLNVLANDVDPNVEKGEKKDLRIVGVKPYLGTVEIIDNGQNLSYTPPSDKSYDRDYFTYTVTDDVMEAQGEYHTGWVYILIKPNGGAKPIISRFPLFNIFMERVMKRFPNSFPIIRSLTSFNTQ